ncbi:MAG: TetR/AcrR family transcriptional regulator, partial [Bacteroidales bacterium]
ATLYNYFKDINELVFLCVSDFQVECSNFIAGQTEKSARGMEKISMIVMSYMKYFLEYPGIFDLFYLEKVGDFGNNQQIIDIIGRSLPEVCEAEWNYCIETKLITKERAELLNSRLTYIVVGLLLFYLNRRTPKDYQEFLDEAKKQVDEVLAN